MDEEPLVAVRIKDGIFIGNAVAAHDEDFLYMNKVTHVINCAGAEVPNLFGGAGVEYITFGFRDAAAASGATTSAGIMFDAHDKNIEQVTRFIDRALDEGECVMVHCIDGSSRSCAMLAGYFVTKYGWKVSNTLSFLQMAHQDMEISEPWLRQLRLFGKRHAVEHDVYDVEVDDMVFALDNDQWMLRNTLLNGLSAHVQEGSALFRECAAQVQLGDPVYKPPTRRRRRLLFVDTNQGTSVASQRTTPVLKTDTGHGSHVDPFDPATGAVRFSGHEGLQELQRIAQRRGVRAAENLTILARYSTAHRRRLESAGDVNAKGRQHLTLRRRQQNTPPAAEVRRVPSMGPIVAAGSRLPASNAPIIRTASNQPPPRVTTQHQQHQQHHSSKQEDDQRSFHPQQNPPSSPRNHVEHTRSHLSQPGLNSSQQHTAASSVASRQHSTVSEDDPSSRRPTSRAPPSRSLVGESRHMAPPVASAARPAYGAPQYRTNNAASTVGPRTPFALSSSSKPRVGSPLPQQRRGTAGGSSTVGTQPQLHTARKTTLTGPSTTSNSSIYSSGSMRPSSPAQRPNVRPSSPTVRNSQPLGGGLDSSVRRAASPLQHSQPGVPLRRGSSPMRPHIGGGASVVQGASGSASSGTIQPTIRRANSPMQRPPVVSSASRSYDASPAQASSAQRPQYPSSSINRSSGGARPSSPMQRGLMPTSNPPVRPSSPNRRLGSSSNLADQYLRGGSNNSAGGRPGTPTGGSGLLSSGAGQSTSSTVGGIRRGSPMQRPRY